MFSEALSSLLQPSARRAAINAMRIRDSLMRMMVDRSNRLCSDLVPPSDVLLVRAARRRSVTLHRAAQRRPSLAQSARMSIGSKRGANRCPMAKATRYAVPQNTNKNA